MNKNLVIAGVLIVAALVGGYFWGQGATSGSLGAVINYYSSLNNVRLYTTLTSLLTDITAVRTPLAGIVATTTAQITWPSVASSTPNTTTTSGGIAAAQGDIVLISPASSTPGVFYSGFVVVASTTSFTLGINALSVQTAAIIPASTTFYVWILPRSSFAAPAALTTTATTSSTGL